MLLKFKTILQISEESFLFKKNCFFFKRLMLFLMVSNVVEVFHIIIWLRKNKMYSIF